MKFLDLLKIANRNLLRNKLRTVLTISAIFVGSFTLVLTNGMSDGMRDYVEKQIKNIEGNNILFLRKRIESKNGKSNRDEPAEYKESSKDAEGNTVDPNEYYLTLDQMEKLKTQFPDVKAITPHYDLEGEYITIDGIKKYELQLGVLSSGVTQKAEAGETINGNNQIMIPLNLAKKLNPDISGLIGNSATIGYKTGQNGDLQTKELKIVGVSTKGFISNFNSFIDAETAREIYDNENKTTDSYNKFDSFTLLLNTSDPKKIEELKTNLDEKGFTAETIADQKKQTYDAIGLVQIGLSFFAFIALLAASFGIINTLVVAVMERTKEIGLQKALGMGRKKIFWLFTLESVLIGFWGAILGVVCGILVGTVTNWILAAAYRESFESYNFFVFRIFSILWVIALICLIGFLAGVLPAFRASRLNPIEALRYE